MEAKNHVSDAFSQLLEVRSPAKKLGFYQQLNCEPFSSLVAILPLPLGLLSAT